MAFELNRPIRNFYSGHIYTIIITLLGLAGSILSLIATNVQLNDNWKQGCIIAGSVISLVLNALSSTTGIKTPHPPYTSPQELLQQAYQQLQQSSEETRKLGPLLPLLSQSQAQDIRQQLDQMGQLREQLLRQLPQQA